MKFSNRSHNQVSQEVNLWLELESYQDHFKTYIADISDYDVVLDLMWLQRVNPQIDWITMCIIITDKNDDEHSIRSWSEPHKCDTPYADYEFVSYNFIKKLTQSSCKKHTPPVFIMHVHKISDKNKPFNKSQISTTTTPSTISPSADVKTELLNCEDV